MCLNRIISNTPEITDWFSAWKVVWVKAYGSVSGSSRKTIIDDSVQAEYHGIFKYDVEYQAEPKGGVIVSNRVGTGLAGLTTKIPGETYPTGFHCFTSLIDAQKYLEYQSYDHHRILEVKVKNILCRGTQDYIYGLVTPMELNVIVTEFIKYFKNSE